LWPGIEIFVFCILKIAVQWALEGRQMTRELSVIIERDAEGYYVGTVPALRGCHSQAHSLDELMVRIHEAAELCLEVHGDSVESLDFVGVQTIRVAS
jgi:predicted RNase H-like HicB family nuclease